MADYQRPPPIGEERAANPDNEATYQFYFEACRKYIEGLLEPEDILFYEYFSPDYMRSFRKKSSLAQDGLVGKMLDKIEEGNQPDKYTKLVEVLIDRDCNKAVSLITGKKIPDAQSKGLFERYLKKHMDYICKNLQVEEVLTHLYSSGVIIQRDFENLKSVATNDHQGASIDLVFKLPSRDQHWLPKFLYILICTDQQFIAEQIDAKVTKELLPLKENKSEFDKYLEGTSLTSLVSVMDGCSGQESGHETKVKEADACNPRMDELRFPQSTASKVPSTPQDQSYNTQSLNMSSYESGAPSNTENNLSPNPGEPSLSSRESSPKPVQNDPSNTSLSFVSLLTTDENTHEQTSMSSQSKGPSSALTGNDASDVNFDLDIPSQEDWHKSSDFSRVNSNNGAASADGIQRVLNDLQLSENDTSDGSQTTNLKTPGATPPPVDNRPVQLLTRAKSTSGKSLEENSPSDYNKTLKDKQIDFADDCARSVPEGRNITEDQPLYQRITPEEKGEEIQLRDYQKELAAPAIKGENVIIVAPTGSGKTHVAIKIIQEHMRNMMGHGISKVIFLVNQVALANQQGEMCKKYLRQYNCQTITGDDQRSKNEYLKDFVDKRDILIVTTQVLLDALVRKEIDSITCFSLIIFDECHHTQSNHPFNQIMGLYMALKFSEHPHGLPQIVGLTASVGVGKARNVDKAVAHIKGLMANLDAHAISTVTSNMAELREYVSMPEEETYTVMKRQDDLFGSKVMQLMGVIEKLLTTHNLIREMPEADKFEQVLRAPANKGSAQYTQWANKLWQDAVVLKSAEARKLIKACRTHLDHYNNALIIHNDARMEDAKEYLEQQMTIWKKHNIMNVMEEKLYQQYIKIKEYKFPQCSNPKLDQLRDLVIKAYGTGEKRDNSRGIVFVRTRDLAYAIVRWMKETPGLRDLDPIVFLGQNPSAGMTKVEQDDALKHFRDGKHKLLVATSVAEEGLDISKCNLVIRYDHVTNEIAMVQSRGRGRAQDSKYFLIADESTGMAEKEELNSIREIMMRKAIIQLKVYIEGNRAKFFEELREIQDEANVERELKARSRNRRLVRAGTFELRCLKCDQFICFSDTIKKIEEAHHVIIDKAITERVRYVDRDVTKFQGQNEQMAGKIICQNCGDALGVICIYKGMEFPVPKIDKFLIVDANDRQIMKKKWRDVPFMVTSLSLKELRDF